MPGASQAQSRLAVLLGGADFVLGVDLSAVTIALPAIQEHFGLSHDALQWVLTAYALPFGGFMLAGGRLSDSLGRRRVFISSVLVFSVSSAVAGLARSLAMLLAARAVQGLAGAALAPSALGLLTSSIATGPERNRAIAICNGMSNSGFVLGIVIGGVLTSSVGWRAVLLVNVPIGLLAAASARMIPPDSHRRGAPPALLPAALMTSGLGTLLLALTANGARGPVTLRAFGLFALGCVQIALFALLEHRAVAPLVPRALRTDRSVVAGIAAALLACAGMTGGVVLLAVYFQESLGLSPIAAAGVLAVPGAGAVAGAIVAPRVVERCGSRRALTRGLRVQLVAALALFATLACSQIVIAVLAATLQAGANVVAVVGATSTIADVVVEPHHGVAAGMVTSAVELGAGLGTSLLTALAALIAGAAPPGDGSGPALAHAVPWAMALGAGLAALALAAGTYVRRDEILELRRP